MNSRAKSVAFATLVLAGLGGCRDWDRFEPVASGGGGADTGAGGAAASTASASTATIASASTTSSTGGGNEGGGGGTPNPGCGTIDILSDTFDGALDWRWDVPDEMNTAEGDLVIYFPAEEWYVQQESTAGFDFRGRSVAIEVKQPPAPGSVVWFNVAGDNSNYVELVLATDMLGSTVRYGYEADDTYVDIGSDTYDPVDHRFWRFREDDGVVYFELSPDGVDWTERTDVTFAGTFDPAEFDPAYTSVYIGGWTGATGATSQVRFGDLVSTDPSNDELCAPSVLTDDYEDGAESSAWADGWESEECVIDEAGGVLSFTCAAMAYSDSAVLSTSAYDLTGSAVSVELVDQPAAGTNAWMALGVGRPDEDFAWTFEVDNGEVALYEMLDGSWGTVGTFIHDPANRFLRIREESGVAYFEVSPDNVTYETVVQRTPSFSVSQVKVWIGAGSNANAVSETMSFDNVNLGP